MKITQTPSPNYVVGRAGYKPEMIVIHVSAGTLASAVSWFQTTQSQVSAHYIVGHDGSINQFVDEANTAWHAGRVLNPTYSLYKPGINPNLYTIGIEHEGNDLSVDGTQAQKQASAALIKQICDTYGIPCDRTHIIGHYQVFSAKPNCPATNKSVIDEIIALANTPISQAKPTGKTIKDATALIQQGLDILNKLS